MSFLTDLQFATRTLRAKPVFTAIAVASLALGIGANTAIFSVVESALLRELPYDHADRLLLLRDNQPDFSAASLAPGEYLDYQKQTRTLSGLAAFSWQSLTLTASGDPQKLRASAVTPNFFEVLGAHPQIGRLFNAAQEKPGADRAAVLSESTWRGMFASDPAILNRTIRLNGNSFRVVGVLRDKESYPADTQVWITPRFVVPEYVEDPHPSQPDLAATYGNHWMNGIGRMREGVTVSQARAELGIIARHDKAFHPGHAPNVAALHEHLVGNIKPALWILLGSVLLLLLIACANMAGLLLSRSATRVRELSVRTALGATKWQIARLLLAESFLLAIAGGLLGTLLADQGQQLLARYSPYDLPAALGPQMNWQVLAFCVAATLLSALLSGLAPALRSSQIDVQDGLKESSKGSASTAANNWRRLLVAAEIALSVVLLCGASLLIHSFTKILDVNPGFDTTNVTTARISLPLTAYSHDAANAFWDKLIARVSALPDVESAAIETNLPLSGNESGSDLKINGISAYSDQVAVSPGVFTALHIPLLAGKNFDGHETEKSAPVVIVSRAFADKLFPHQNPIGRKFEGAPIDGQPTIIGIVADVKFTGLNEPAPLMMYFAPAQYGVDSASLIVKTKRPADITNELRAVLHSLDPGLPLSDSKPLAAYVDGSLETKRFLLGLLTAFASLAILLAGIGLYGVLAFSVEQRTREIGIRIALGAERHEILRLLLTESSLVAISGLAIGLIAAFWSSSLLKNMLYGVTATDSAAYLAATILVLAIAAIASFLPSLRATRVDPVTALRYE
jgi:putative ABC transport system permease protein